MLGASSSSPSRMLSWRPSLFERSRWPLLLLLSSIALTAVAVIDAQRAARTNVAVAERALREYAVFAAWSYVQRLDQEMDDLARQTLGAVNHGDQMHTSPRVPTAAELAHYLPWDQRCMCHRLPAGPAPGSFFALRIGSGSIDVGVNTHQMPMEGWEVDRPLMNPVPLGAVVNYPAAERRWLVDTLTRRIRNAGHPDHGYDYLIGAPAGEQHLLAYTLMPTVWGDTMVYGARYDVATVRGNLGDVLDAEGLLPSSVTEGRRNRDVLVVRVRDRSGTLLYDSAPGVESPLGSTVRLDDRHGSLIVEALIRPEMAPALIIGGLPRSRLPFLLGLLGLAAALTIVAIAQLRRETALARLRAEFVSSVSHELRTPLAQIRLYLDTLRLGRARTDAQREWSMAHIDRETTRLGHLVENVLRFSRLGQGAGERAAPIDPGEQAAQIVEEYRPLAASQRATIVLEREPVPELSLAPDTLRHILLNLLANAVKYGAQGQTITVSVRAVGREVRIAVSDEGHGVAPEEREAIWRPFTRGRAASATGGSGIGLTIVRATAEQHGGRAWVESPESGRGARFVVALPASAELAPSPADVASIPHVAVTT